MSEPAPGPSPDFRHSLDRREAGLLAFHLRDAEQTEQLGEVLGDLLRSTASHAGATAILLSGDLGAGKTTLVRGLARGLGCDASAVASPTFTLRMDHPGEARLLAHIDAWRIGPGDLDALGWDELLGGDAVLAIEWPERLASALPHRAIRLALDHADGLACAADGDEPSDARSAHLDLRALPQREAARLEEGLRLLVRAPRQAVPACPTCGTLLETPRKAGEPPAAGHADASYAPFCSRRCRMADLGDWLSMRHRIAGKETPEFDE